MQRARSDSFCCCAFKFSNSPHGRLHNNKSSEARRWSFWTLLRTSARSLSIIITVSHKERKPPSALQLSHWGLMRRDLWLKQWWADCCKNSFQGASSSESAYFLTRALPVTNTDWLLRTLNTYMHLDMQTRVAKHAHVHADVSTAFTELSSPRCAIPLFEYNSHVWRCCRELSKQLCRPLLRLRRARRAAGRGSVWKSLSPVKSVAMKSSSDRQKAQLTKAAWPKTANNSTFFKTVAGLSASFNPVAVSKILFHSFVLPSFSDLFYYSYCGLCNANILTVWDKCRGRSQLRYNYAYVPFLLALFNIQCKM